MLVTKIFLQTSTIFIQIIEASQNAYFYVFTHFFLIWFYLICLATLLFNKMYVLFFCYLQVDYICKLLRNHKYDTRSFDQNLASLAAKLSSVNEEHQMKKGRIETNGDAMSIFRTLLWNYTSQKSHCSSQESCNNVGCTLSGRNVM